MDDLNMDSLDLSGMNESDFDELSDEITPGGDNEWNETEDVLVVDDDYESDMPAEPVISEMSDEFTDAAPKAENSSYAAVKQESDVKNTEKSMSAMEKRMSEPFDMPGAYIPGEKYDPANSAPRPTITSDSGSAYQKSVSAQENRNDALDRMYEQRQQNYQKGAKKAKILGIVVILIAAFDFFSSISSSYAGKLDKALAIASLALMVYGSWKFMKGSKGCRSMLGILSLLDAIHAVTGGFTAVRAINLLNVLLDSKISTAPYIFMAVLKAVVFGVMAYFFLLDDDVSNFTTED